MLLTRGSGTTDKHLQSKWHLFVRLCQHFDIVLIGFCELTVFEFKYFDLLRFDAVVVLHLNSS